MRGVSGLLLLLLLAGACGTAATPVELSGSATQFRTDEGTQHLSAGLHNDGKQAVTVDKVRLDWPGLKGTWTRVAKAVAPDDGIAFKVPFEQGSCEPTDAAPHLIVDVDGDRTRLPVSVEPGLLARLQHRLCGLARLADSADVVLADGQVTAAGYVTDLVVRRAAGREPVTLTEVGGSVLLRMLATGLPRPLGTTADAVARIPLTIAAAPRCDAHAQSQSSQTFLLSAYFRVGTGERAEDVRVILPLTTAVKADLQSVITAGCR